MRASVSSFSELARMTGSYSGLFRGYWVLVQQSVSGSEVFAPVAVIV
jgi:hypothetical protein